MNKPKYTLTKTEKCPLCGDAGVMESPLYGNYTVEKQSGIISGHISFAVWLKERRYTDDDIANYGKDYIPCTTCNGKGEITSECDISEALMELGLLDYEDGTPAFKYDLEDFKRRIIKLEGGA